MKAEGKAWVAAFITAALWGNAAGLILTALYEGVSWSGTEIYLATLGASFSVLAGAVTAAATAVYVDAV